MHINLRKYQKSKVLKQDGEFSILLQDLEVYNGDDFKFVDDVRVKANVFISEDLMKLKFDISTKFKFNCSRCLIEFIEDFNLKCDDEILLSNLDEDIILDSEQNLDFRDYIKNCVIINIPQKKLCKDDCFGLCQKCGINLNNNKCSCEKEEFNNVFSKLKDTFVDFKEVE